MAPGKLLPFAPGAPREAAPGQAPRPLAELEDDELMRLSRTGRGAAFDELVRRHQRRVLGVAAQYVASAAAARDVAQGAFLELYRAVPSYQPRGAFTSFLYRIALNQARMARRSARAYERRLAAAADELVFADGADPETSDARLLARERRREVQRAVDQLSEKLRAVVVLRYSGELPYQEIAGVLGVPLGTVKRRLFDALAALRAQLESP